MGHSPPNFSPKLEPIHGTSMNYDVFLIFYVIEVIISHFR